MELKTNGYTITTEGFKQGFVLTSFSDVKSIKILEGSTTYKIVAYNRPLLSNTNVNVPRVNVRIGNTRINTTNRNTVSGGTKGFSIKLREAEVQTMHNIIMAGFAGAQCEERSAKYLEQKMGVFVFSMFIFFFGIIFAMLGPSMIDLPSFLSTGVICGIVLAVVVGINILGMITRDKSKKIKVYR